MKVATMEDIAPFDLCDEVELGILKVLKAAILAGVSKDEDKEKWFNDRFVSVCREDPTHMGIAMTTDKNIFYFFAPEENDRILPFKKNLKYEAFSPLPVIPYKEVTSRSIANILAKFNQAPKYR